MVRGSFTTALNEILLVAAVISVVAGVLAFLLIRSKDFVPQDQEPAAPDAVQRPWVEAGEGQP